MSSGFWIPSSQLSDSSINESFIPEADFDPFAFMHSLTEDTTKKQNTD